MNGKKGSTDLMQAKVDGAGEGSGDDDVGRILEPLLVGVDAEVREKGLGEP